MYVHHTGMVQYSTADGTVVTQFGNGGQGDFSDGVVRTLTRALPTEVTLGGMERPFAWLVCLGP